MKKDYWGEGWVIESQFVKAVDEAVKQVVHDFQDDSNRYWNERDIHWSLFRHLKNQAVFQRSYAPEIVRAEFPTRGLSRKDGIGEKARGYYDLVVLDPDSLNKPAVSAMTRWTPWSDFLPLVDVLVAIEVKVWSSRLQNIDQIINWDIRKLTCPENAVKHPYFLNFVQLRHQHMEDYCSLLKESLAKELGLYPKLKILCAPCDPQFCPQSDYWVSVPN